MSKWGRFICCFLLLAATAGCPWERGDDDNNEIDIDVPSYANFHSGAEWDFVGGNNDAKTVVYDGLQSVLGFADQVHVLRDDDGNRLYFKKDLTDRLYLVGTSNDGVYHDELPLLRSSFDPDKRYGAYETDDSDCNVYVTHQRDSVTVPDDHYDHVVLTTVTTTCNGFPPKTTVEKYWFAKDTGLVKWLDKDGDLWELNDHQ